jgi:DNA-binding XRE family transcriptional regulator
MPKRTKEWKFPNLEMWMWELQISVSDLAEILHLTRQTVYNKLNGRYDFSSLQMRVIREEMERRTKRKITNEFLFKKEDSPNG